MLRSSSCFLVCHDDALFIRGPGQLSAARISKIMAQNPARTLEIKPSPAESRIALGFCRVKLILRVRRSTGTRTGDTPWRPSPWTRRVSAGDHRRKRRLASKERVKERRESSREDLLRRLPDDALADILRRLGWRDLAVSRCVRKSWCGVIEAHRLMLPHLLPHEVAGIFIKFNNLDFLGVLRAPHHGPQGLRRPRLLASQRGMGMGLGVGDQGSLQRPFGL